MEIAEIQGFVEMCFRLFVLFDVSDSTFEKKTDKQS